ncbi:MAG TPA: alpha/beta hydrolase [Acidimicrobiia bacterium]|jgi:acetyl esterase/lipase
MKLPARDIPVPSSVSAEAQAVLAAGPMSTAGDYPALDDHEAWRTMIAASNESIMLSLAPRAGQLGAHLDTAEVAGVPVCVVTPKGVDDADLRVYLQIHGGALTSGAGPACGVMAATAATRVRARTWAVDYRMPPDHPYPAGLDDCVAVYRALLEQYPPGNVVVGGESAGGNLAAALILRARDEGLPLPAAAVLMTPELDLTESGDSFRTNLGVDTVLTRSLMPANLLYAGGHDLTDPSVSPLFGDFTKGFPPTILTAGTRDLFLSNAVRMHRALRAAGIEAELHLEEAAPHAGFFGAAPEDVAIDREVRAFANAHWGVTRG